VQIAVANAAELDVDRHVGLGRVAALQLEGAEGLLGVEGSVGVCGVGHGGSGEGGPL
jgi:hypothetical protein